jgi:hypothetical protein
MQAKAIAARGYFYFSFTGSAGKAQFVAAK